MIQTNYLKTMAAISLLTIGVGCAKKVAVTPPPPAPVAQAAQQPAPAERPAASPAPATAPVAQTTPSKYPDAATRAHIDELLARIQDAYFDYNRQTLREDAVKTLTVDAKELAGIMSQYPDYKLQVEGYCDERGSAEYNMALGEARARAARDFLVSAGVGSTQLSTLSFGKERQVCDDHDESCWAKNRRVHIVATKE